MTCSLYPFLHDRFLYMKAFLVLIVCLLAFVGVQAQANTAPPTASPDQKAEAIIKQAIDALGGSTYLNVQTVIGRGFYTAYQDGMSQIPTRFLDYLVFPDKERTEFTSSGIRVVQTNVKDTGWLYDGATKSINDQKPAQIEDFKRAMRTTIDNVLRGWWRNEKAVISYAGRREAGLAKRNETVRLTYPDGFWVEFEFGAKDGLPSKVIYKRTRKKADTDEDEEVTEEDRFAKPITIEGVTSPFIIDHFVNGQQTSRINYESVEYNRPVPDSLFVKPTDPKKFK